MTGLTYALVNQYIAEAQAVAKSETERLAVQLAAKMNAPSTGIKRKRNPHVEPKNESKAEKEVRSWEDLILEEIHTALCTERKKYRKEVADLKHNAKLLIAGIAGYVAAKLGVPVAVVAALVASLLNILLGMGVSVFCKRFEAGML